MYDVRIGAEEADALVAAVLMETFERVSREIMSAKGRLRELKPHQIEDLTHDMALQDAIKVVLKDFMIHEDYLDFMEMQRVYGNV